ncbi:conserved hypothetical protein [Candidatus Defluviicoccus seviourii]|uniref:Fido domain-containing protein n=1 Tax=Candidatus Defluviicoccus seviourii TaxID=2565273 RepID=A0A564WE55_9PROT|nr:conserved hypothetical protein [Candidatus Defluviicoccus seviourii]
MGEHVLDLDAIESSLRTVQRNFSEINRVINTPRDTLDDQVITNMMAGYRYVDALTADGVDLFAIGASKHFLELNALVLCGTDPLERIREDAHLKATAQRFYEEDRGTISDLAAWYALHRDETAWTRAAGLYVRLLSEPQLFIEGNHRTGALIMSCILVREGRPPFVLSIDNAQGYFDPSTLITKTKKTPIGMLFRIPKLKKEFASFLRENADDRYLLHRAVTPAA